jgi:cobalt transporter subunit CbtA
MTPAPSAPFPDRRRRAVPTALVGKVVLAGVLGGLVAGMLLTGIQMIEVLPLALEAEAYEHAAATAREAHLVETSAAAEGAPEGVERALGAAIRNTLASIAFGLVLCTGFALRGGVDTREGALWGLGGFLAFSMTPALGLPPAIAAVPDDQLLVRALWWVFAAGSSAGGLALLAFRREGVAALGGAALLLLPHAVGAPVAPSLPGSAPLTLLHDFTAASVLANGIHWVLLGTVCAFLFGSNARTLMGPDQRPGAG